MSHPPRIARVGLAASILLSLLVAPATAHAADDPPAVVDTTPPSLTVVTPQEGAIYRVGTSITIDIACDDLESAVTRCDGAYNQPGQTVLLDTPGEYHWIYVAGDAAGLTTRQDVRFRVIPDDHESPVIDWLVRASDPDAWQTAPTEVLFWIASEPGGSGIQRFAVTDSRTGEVTESTGGAITVTAVHDGATVFTAVATDRAGNAAVAPPVTVRVDDGVPYIDVRAPGSGAVVERGTPLRLDYSCHDDGSGIDVCRADGGDALDTSVVGGFTTRIWARDRVGRVVFLDVDYTVVPRSDTPPSIELRLPPTPEGGVHIGPVRAELVATDDDGIAAIHWRIDGGEWQAVEADRVEFVAPCGATTTVDYWTIDDAGSRTETISGSIESVCPTEEPTPGEPGGPGDGSAGGTSPSGLAATGGPFPALGAALALLLMAGGAALVRARVRRA